MKQSDLTEALENVIKMSKQLEENQKIIGKELAKLRGDNWLLEKENKELKEEVAEWKKIALEQKK